MDDIDSKVIKLAAVPLLQPITFLINLSISTQTFPTKWKIGHVSPLYKGKGLPRHLPSSYQPITLLPIISKLTEKAVQEQMVIYMGERKEKSIPTSTLTEPDLAQPPTATVRSVI